MLTKKSISGPMLASIMSILLVLGGGIIVVNLASSPTNAQCTPEQIVLGTPGCSTNVDAGNGGDTTTPSSVAPDNSKQGQGSGSNPSGNTPYGLNPQPQIGHPSQYVETGVPCKNQPTAPGLTCSDVDNHTRRWAFEILPGSIAIVGGFTVDGVSDGVYKAVEGDKVDVTVTDGFLSIIEKQWACGEFDFRVAQAVEFDWARAHVTPPSGCNTSGSSQPANSSTATTAAPTQPASPAPAGGTRTPTGVKQSKPFKAHEPVIGFKIVSGGKTYSQCYLTDPPADGTLTDGVIFPNKEEVAKAKVC